MEISIESTTAIVEVNGIKCRVWEGATASGVKVQCLIVRVAADKGEDLSQFERELTECRAPSAAMPAFPLRLVL